MKAASVSSAARLRCFLSVAIVMFAGTLLIAPSAIAQSTVYTPISTLEAVNPDGFLFTFSWPADGSPITVMGIVLNNPSDMLDSTPNYPLNTIPMRQPRRPVADLHPSLQRFDRRP